MAVLSKVANIAVSPNPVGVVQPYAGSNPPVGWLICDGSQVSRTLYPELFSVLGTTYGSGDGSSTFTLPDLRGRTIAGKDGVNNMNNGPTNRLTSTYFGASGTALGNNGGAESHTLTTAQLASHTHTQDAHTHQVRVNSFAGDRQIACGPLGADGDKYSFTDSGNDASTNSAVLYAASSTATNQNTGGGGAHNNTQPTIILNYIIKATSDLARGGWYNSSTPDLVTSLPTNPFNGQEVYLQQTVASTVYQTAKRYDASTATWYDTGAVSKPAWISPTFVNGWANYGGGYDTAGYLNTPDGMVILKGLLNGASKTSDIPFVLPAGYRPSGRKLFPATSGEPWTVSRIDVDTSGNVYANRTGNTWVGLDGVSFYAEA